MDVRCAGWTKTKPATADIQKLCDQVRSQVQAKRYKTYQEFKAIEYRSLAAAGVFYLIKVYVGGRDVIQMYVFQSPHLEGKPETKVGRVENHKATDPLVPSTPYL